MFEALIPCVFSQKSQFYKKIILKKQNTYNRFLCPVKPLYAFNNSYQNQFVFLFEFSQKITSTTIRKIFKEI